MHLPEDPYAARHYQFVARGIAEALAAVGSWATYRQATLVARERAGRLPVQDAPQRDDIVLGEQSKSSLSVSRISRSVRSWRRTISIGRLQRPLARLRELSLSDDQDALASVEELREAGADWAISPILKSGPGCDLGDRKG